jgi:hypothetical protein
LCRWVSAMKFAFPGTEGVMMVSHQHGYSAVGLYHPARGVPNCLVAKHEVGGGARFFWSTEVDPPRAIDEGGSTRPVGWGFTRRARSRPNYRLSERIPGCLRVRGM